MTPAEEIDQLIGALTAMARRDVGEPWAAEFASVGTALHPGSTEKLMEYWTHGEGGTAKIRWAEPCPFCRCLAHLRKYFPKDTEGLCHNLEERATGHRPNVENSRTKHCPC